MGVSVIIPGPTPVEPKRIRAAMSDVTDRYVSFKGIDCEGNSARLLKHILAIIEDPAKTNAFWDRFKERLSQAGALQARTADELCLLCSHTYYIEELFEEHGDEDGLAILRQLEEECC